MKGRKQNATSSSVDPAVVERVDRILEERNVDGKVPYEIAMRLLDDMHIVACQMASWSCASYYRAGLHDQCPRTVHEPDSRRRVA